MTTVLSPTSFTSGAGEAHLRPMRSDDAAEAARIMFEAFAGIADRHGFPRDFTAGSARQLVDAFLPHPSIWAVAAERNGRVVGSNFLDQRSPVAGVGPITVATDAQAAGVGRLLMRAVLDRAADTPGTEGIRLLQDSFNTASLALYASLGFVATDPVVLMGGRPVAPPFTGVEVRPLTEDDVEACDHLHQAVHGYERSAELRDALAAPHLQPLVAVRGGHVVAYATTLHAFGAAHAVAQTEDDLAALIAGGLAGTDAEASFLLPVRQDVLFRWCLAAGLRVVKPMTYMAYGPYRRPEGAWLPSVLS